MKINRKNKYKIGSLLKDDVGVFLILKIYEYECKVLTNYGKISYWRKDTINNDNLIIY